MFNNVLVGVDGRPGGRDAIALASRLVDPNGKLTLVHVHSGPLRPSHAVMPNMVREAREASAKLLEQERADSAVEAELLSLVGYNPGSALHRQAEEQGADLLVVGSCSRGFLGRAMLGDDTRRALNGAPCATAIAALGYAEHPKPFAKIGVGYDTSPESELALQTARELAQASKATIEVLEVISIPTFGYAGILAPVAMENLKDLLEEARERLNRIPDVHARAIYGLSGEELAALSGTVDLLAVGSRGYGPMRRMMIGSTSGYLQRHARCSLLVLPRSLTTEHLAEEQSEVVEHSDVREPTMTHAAGR